MPVDIFYAPMWIHAASRLLSTASTARSSLDVFPGNGLAGSDCHWGHSGRSCNSRLAGCGRAQHIVDDMEDGLAHRDIGEDDLCRIASSSLHLDVAVAGLGNLQHELNRSQSET